MHRIHDSPGSHSRSVQLSFQHHRNPFDRLLIAQTEVEGLTLVTADGQMNDYEVEVLW